MTALKSRLPFNHTNTPVVFQYKNYRGEVSLRRAVLREIYYGVSHYHPDPQWLIRGYDLEKQADRDFAMADITPVPLYAEIPVDAPLTVKPSPTSDPFTVKIKKSPLGSVRDDLPKLFTWSPTDLQRAQCEMNHNKSLGEMNESGGLTWAELASVLQTVYTVNRPELQAVGICTTLYPQEGFTL